MLDAVPFVADVERSLRLSAKPERAEFEKKYLKSDLRFIGAAMPAVRAECARQYELLKAIGRNDLDPLTDELWKSNCHELRSMAICLMVRFAGLFGRKDLPRIQWMISESAGWAHVDWIATDLAGSIYSRDPAIEPTLRNWAKNADFWVRRASMLALLGEAKKGNRVAFDLFCELAAPMVPEKEFFIRKAIGWILREVSKKNPDWTFEFLAKNPNVAGLTFREAAKYLPDSLLAKLNN